MDLLPLLAVIVAAALVLFGLIMRLKLHAFVALLLVSIATALAVGVSPGDIAEIIEDGMGGTLGFVAVVVGLGAMFGQVLKESGAAAKMADTIVEAFGEKRVPWSLGLAGFIVAVPVFFDVGLVLLMPIVYRLVRRLGVGLLVLALPLLAGLSAAHSLVPPTPGPVAAAAALGADLGWVIVFGFVAGLPAVVVAGVWYGRWIGDRVEVSLPEGLADEVEDDVEPPSFWLVLAVLAAPLALIMTGTLSETLLEEDSTAALWLGFIGDPFVALIVAVLLAFYVLGTRQGLSRERVQGAATRALEPVGLILLVTGAGGVFGAVLEAGGVDDVLEEVLEATGMPVILLAFLAALVFRVVLGSGVPAMVTSAAIVAQVAEGQQLGAPMLGAIVVAIGAGSTVLSHVNDSGFWLASRYLNLDEKATLRVWTVMQTILGAVAFLIVLALSPLLA